MPRYSSETTELVTTAEFMRLLTLTMSHPSVGAELTQHQILSLAANVATYAKVRKQQTNLSEGNK